MRGKCTLFFCNIVLISNIILCEAQRIPEEVSYEEDVAITAREKQALDKFKRLVIPKIPKHSYIQNYVKDDLYFIKWLRAASFNVENAEIRLLEHLRWREAQRMDTVSDDQFPDFVREFAVHLNVTDKRHRPSAEVWFGEWKLREAALTGKGPDAIRWLLTNCVERLQRQLFEARSKGVKVSQIVILVDVSGFSLVQHACPLCLPIVAGCTLGYVKQYPGFVESFIITNTPPAFDIILRVVKPILGSQHGRSLKVFAGKNKWGPYVNGRYEKSQLSPRFGGSRDREGERY